MSIVYFTVPELVEMTKTAEQEIKNLENNIIIFLDHIRECEDTISTYKGKGYEICQHLIPTYENTMITWNANIVKTNKIIEIWKECIDLYYVQIVQGFKEWKNERKISSIIMPCRF